MTNKPEQKFRAGAVSATIWNNEYRKDGKTGTFKSITLERCYKDKDDEWQSTNKLDTNDLPKAVVVLSKAFEYISLKEEVPA